MSKGHRLGGIVFALSLGLASSGIAHAQQGQPPAGGPGILLGEVDRCVNGTPTPVANVAVGVLGGNGNMVRSDASGLFALALAPGQYTIQARADDGAVANRPYVPVESNATLDIGVLALAGGCPEDLGAPVPAPAQPTAQPTAAPTPAPTVAPPPATPAPTVAPAPPTAVPAQDQQMPSTDEQAPADQSAPADQPPVDDSGDMG
jgi:hypothetical protein